MSLLRRIPTAARWCALVAFLNCLAWALVTPTFHVPDETGHVAYVQHLAETGTIPNDPQAPGISDEEAGLMNALQFPVIVGRPNDLSIWSSRYQRGVEQTTRVRPNPASGGGTIETSSQPPLYYGLGAAIYAASPWHGLVQRVFLLRLLSALLSALTVVFVFLFLRELFSQPWVWTVGALAVAFQPLFGFLGGGVTPDTLFFTASAALLFCLARAFRRGLTPQLGAAIGLSLCVGFLTKINFLAIVPGALLALLLLVLLAKPGRRPALAGAAVAVAMLAVTAVGYMALNELVWDRQLLGGAVENAAKTAATGESVAAPITLRDQLSYTWQLYLPRLPFMNDQFAYFPPWRSWFQGGVGRFGWLDTPFPTWVYWLALGLGALILALAATALVRRRALLVRRWPELLAFAVMVAGLAGSVGFLGIRYFRESGNVFEQARYLLPFAPFYGALIGLAALGAGRRWGRQVGAALVVLAMAHGLFAQLLVIARFYG